MSNTGTLYINNGQERLTLFCCRSADGNLSFIDFPVKLFHCPLNTLLFKLDFQSTLQTLTLKYPLLELDANCDVGLHFQ